MFIFYYLSKLFFLFGWFWLGATCTGTQELFLTLCSGIALGTLGGEFWESNRVGHVQGRHLTCSTISPVPISKFFEIVLCTCSFGLEL